MECSPLLVLWLVLAQPENNSIYLMFDKKYVCLSGEILGVFISWVMEQRKAFEIHGITMLEDKYAEYVVRVERWVNEPLSPFPQQF